MKRADLVLTSTINRIFRNKHDFKELDEQIKKDTKYIKEKLAERKITEFETDSCKAVITYQQRNSMDEEKLIEILKNYLSKTGQEKVIKTKEYVDYDELEKLIYNGVIPAEKLEPAQTTKTIAVLNVKQRKENKNV